MMTTEMYGEVLELDQDQIDEIKNTLPPELLPLLDQYPGCLSNAAFVWGEPPLPDGYVPHDIDIYYLDCADNPNLVIHDETVTKYIPLPPGEEAKVTMIDVDGLWAFIKAGDTVIINRMENIKLPEVLVNPEAFQRAVNALNKNKFNH